MVICPNQICNLTKQWLQLDLQTFTHSFVCICVLQQFACLCFNSLWLSSSGATCSQPPRWIVQFCIMKTVGMSATLYCFINLYSSLKNRWTTYLYPLEMLQIQSLGILRICLKCIWQRDLKILHQEYFLRRKSVFYINSNYCGKLFIFFVCSRKDIPFNLYLFWSIKKANISVSFPQNRNVFNY